MSQRYSGGLITTNTNINNSIFFNGSSTWLTFAGASQYAIANSTTPFTVECWIKPIGSGGVILSEGFTGTGNTLSLVCSLATSNTVENTAGNFPAFGWFNGSAWVTAAASTTAIVLNVWSHVAFVFTGSTSRIYINGIDVTKPSLPTPATTWGVTGVNGDGWYIGRAWTGGGNTPNANISNLRFVNGTAVYTANFAPPYTLAPITNTALLTCQPYNFVGNLFDNSSYNATITIVGPITAVRDNPFGIFSPPYNPALGAATPGVWELNEAAAAAAQRSWNMYDPFFNRNTGMVHGNGTNGGTNNTFLDSSTNNFAVTRNGNTTQGTFTPFSLPAGYWSNSFDGSGDYLVVAGNSNLAFGTGNFTIECFFYLRDAVTSGFIYDARTATNQAVPCILTGANTVQYYVSGAGRITSGLIAGNKWYHLVISRVSGSTRMFLDGVQTGATYTDATNYINNTNRPVIGTNGDNVSFFCNGYVSNLRVLNGTGTTAPTVPTAPLTAITNTQLLTCQSNRFVDNSANAYAITRAGDARTIGFSPFYNPTAYLPQNNGGAMFFDGSGDYLACTNNTTFGTGNFTVECWLYMPVITNTFSSGIIATANYNGVDRGWSLELNASGNPRFFIFTSAGAGAVVTSSTLLLANQWTHLAAVRSGTTVTIYMNGASIASGTIATTDDFSGPIYVATIATSFAIGVRGYSYAGWISNARVVNGTAVYTSAFTPPTAPLTAITNTQLLLSGTNASFIDNAANLTIETVNTSISTAQSKYGSGSMLFNGTSAYANIITPFGNGGNVVNTLGDFTIEGWVYLNSISANQEIFYINGNTVSYAAVRLAANATSGNISLLCSTNGTTHAINVTNSTSPLTINRWIHLAVVRTGGSIIVYFNGTAIITSVSIGATTALLVGTTSALGAILNSSWTSFFNGYISDFRVTSYARYLGNFTPPTSTLQNQ